MKKIVVAILLIISCFLVFQPVLAEAPFLEGINKRLKNVQGDENNERFASVDSPEGWAAVIGNVIQAFLTFVGLIFFVLLIYGGGKYLLARGEKEKAAEAREVLKAAIIGLLIVILAYVITTAIFALMLP